MTVSLKTLVNPPLSTLLSASATVVANKVYRITATSSGTFTLPASPTQGDEVTFLDGDSTRPHSIAGNGKNIQGSASNYSLSTAGFKVTFWYNGTEWRVA